MWGKIVTGVLLLAYPFAVHLALVFDQVSIASIVLLLVSASCIVASLAGATGSRGSRRGFLLLFGALAVFSLLNLISNTQYALYLPPVIINLTMLAIFANTLRPGREPLITKLHRLTVNQAIDPTMAVHTRRLTWIWVFLFAAMALESAALAVFASLAVWSLFANFLNYVFVIALLVGEYFYRVVRYRDQPHPSLAQFLRNLARVDWMHSSHSK